MAKSKNHTTHNQCEYMSRREEKLKFTPQLMWLVDFTPVACVQKLNVTVHQSFILLYS